MPGRCIQFIGGSWWSSITCQGRTCRLWRLGTAIFFYLSAITSDQDAAALRTFTPIEMGVEDPADGISAGDFAVGQGLLELGDASAGDLA
jgi:hypothetical protein